MPASLYLWEGSRHWVKGNPPLPEATWGGCAGQWVRAGVEDVGRPREPRSEVVWAPAPTPTPGKRLHLSGPPCSHLRDEDNNCHCGELLGAPNALPGATPTFRLGVKDDWVTPLTPGPLEGRASLGPCTHLQLIARVALELQGKERDASRIHRDQLSPRTLWMQGKEALDQAHPGQPRPPAEAPFTSHHGKE